MNQEEKHTLNIQINLEPDKKVVLFIASCASFFVPFMSSSINVALPVISAKFSLNAVVSTWVATAFILASTIFLLPISRAADFYGRKKIFLIGQFLFAITTILCGLSINIEMLIAFRFFQGISASMIFATSMSIVTSTFQQKERGKALGITTAAIYIGLFSGPFIGGILTHLFGWRSIFYLTSVFAIIVCIITKIFIKKEWSWENKVKFDIWGSIIYSLSLVLIMYGCSIIPNKTGIFSAFSGLLLFVCFLIIEENIKIPMFDIKLFISNKVFAFSNITAFLNYCATFAVTFLISYFLQYNKGLKPSYAGFILLISPAIQSFIAPLSGRLSDKIEPRLISSFGMGISCISLISFIFINNNSSLFSIVTKLIILGIGFAMFGSPNSNAVMSSVDKNHYGIATGILGTMRLLGQMMSMVIITSILVLKIGSAKLTPENYSLYLESMRISFAILSLLCFLGIFTSLARGNIRELE